jgi:hypothetical protein
MSKKQPQLIAAINPKPKLIDAINPEYIDEFAERTQAYFENDLLIKAIKSNRIDKFTTLIKKKDKIPKNILQNILNFSIDEKNPKKDPRLFIEALSKVVSPEVLRSLMNEKDFNNFTPLCHAVNSRHQFGVIDCLIGYGADVTKSPAAIKEKVRMEIHLGQNSRFISQHIDEIKKEKEIIDQSTLFNWTIEADNLEVFSTLLAENFELPKNLFELIIEKANKIKEPAPFIEKFCNELERFEQIGQNFEKLKSLTLDNKDKTTSLIHAFELMSRRDDRQTFLPKVFEILIKYGADPDESLRGIEDELRKEQFTEIMKQLTPSKSPNNPSLLTLDPKETCQQCCVS